MTDYKYFDGSGEEIALISHTPPLTYTNGIEGPGAPVIEAAHALACFAAAARREPEAFGNQLRQITEIEVMGQKVSLAQIEKAIPDALRILNAEESFALGQIFPPEAA